MSVHTRNTDEARASDKLSQKKSFARLSDAVGLTVFTSRRSHPDMNSATSSRSRHRSRLQAAAAALLILAFFATGTALIVRCVVALAETPAEVFGNGR